MMPKNAYWKILWNQISLVGTWNSLFTLRTAVGISDGEEIKHLTDHKTRHESDQDDWQYVLNRINEQKIHPNQLITHRFALP